MNDTILFVDDNPRLLSAARVTLNMNGYEVITASNSSEAIQMLQHTRPDLIISDIMMPGGDGFSLLEAIHSRPDWVAIPFLFLSAMDEREARSRSRELGADDFLSKPFSPRELVRAVRSRLERAICLQQTFTNEAYLKTVLALANAIEARDPLTGGHVERVAHLSVCLARAMNWEQARLDELHLSAILHDIGKIALPDSILNKAGQLTAQEWALIKTHPLKGVEILAPLQLSNAVIAGVRSHHEKYNGSGYPDALAGSGIPVFGRLLAVIDAFDAMTNDRPYRKAMPPAGAYTHLRAGAGAHFDPEIVSAFIDLMEREGVV